MICKKETGYKNIIILVNDIHRINLQEFCIWP